MLTDAWIERILTALPNKTVGLLGDLFLDRYLDIDGKLTEPSIETGLDAYQVVGVRSYPGALGTIINNLSALGVGTIAPIAFIGDDGEGYELLQALRHLPGVSCDQLFQLADRRTPTYTKPMLGGDGPAQELNRLDIKNRRQTSAATEDRLIALLEAAFSKCDAWLVLDQVSEVDCGVVTGRVRQRLAELAAKDPGKLCLADSRKRIGEFRSVSIKPNAAELEIAEDAAARLLPNMATDLGAAIFCTRGPDGILLAEPRAEKVTVVPGFPVRGPVDIVGAGDSCGAGIASAAVAGAPLATAAAFGNLVASITVQQIGVTGTASPSQVRARWAEVRATP